MRQQQQRAARLHSHKNQNITLEPNNQHRKKKIRGRKKEEEERNTINKTNRTEAYHPSRNPRSLLGGGAAY